MESGHYKIKMDNPIFVDEETIPMIHRDEDYDDYNTPNTSRIDETSFTEPDATEATSFLQLRQKVKQDKLTALYRHLNVAGDLEMREFLGIDKALQSIHGELLNNTSKLTEINKRIEGDTKKLEEVENDPTYSDEQRQLYKDRLDDLNTKK